ncbi:MAG: acyl-CoA dehydrogenase domain protein [Actinomycetia bacterium]|nr:acyl-CoA dehydrogenase domain protein [Actinomycetes bacterium]
MDFEPTTEQRGVLDALTTLLARHAGTARARTGAGQGYDADLDRALREAGFLSLFGAEGAGPLEAELVVEQVARHLGSVTIGANALVGPALGIEADRGPIALVANPAVPIRYGAEAEIALVVQGDEAWYYTLQPDVVTVVESPYGVPLARLAPRDGHSLGPGSSGRMLAWWRVAIAAEAVGLMSGAFALTLTHVRGRKQNDRTIGSYQAVQHRLAECEVLLDGSRWLARQAAWLGAPEEESAAAAALAVATALRLNREVHQVTGAIGLTREYDLHLWTQRLRLVTLELSGLLGQRRALAQARWVHQDV